MTDNLIIKSGEKTIKINKDKIKAIEVKSEGIISLIYESESDSLVTVQVKEENDLEGFTQALLYIGELDGGYSN